MPFGCLYGLQADKESEELFFSWKLIGGNSENSDQNVS